MAQRRITAQVWSREGGTALEALERRRVVVQGTVQGVGFRPFAAYYNFGRFSLAAGRAVLPVISIATATRKERA